MFSIVAMNSIGRDKTKSNTPFELNFLWIPCLVSNIKNIYIRVLMKTVNDLFLLKKAVIQFINKCTTHGLSDQQDQKHIQRFNH